jgi:hypothetical protein
MVISPPGGAPKPRSVKYRMVVNMRHVNNYLDKKAFKFEGRKEFLDMVEKGIMRSPTTSPLDVTPWGCTQAPTRS